MGPQSTGTVPAHVSAAAAGYFLNVNCDLAHHRPMNSERGTVIFSHGKESGPWGSKILAMAEVARAASFGVLSVDYQGIDSPDERVAKLLSSARSITTPRVLIGSSMGGHVSAAAAAPLQARGLFLLAPAFYMPGFEAHTPREIPCPTAIVHGWRDDIVPVENSIRWARQQRATLHILDSDHRLQDRIVDICVLLREFLSAITC
jgi:pimeloyl-ACP methyl ester carboxylesterase